MEFNRTAGDHPDCIEGPPISLDWQYVEREPMSVDHYEGSRRRSGLFVLPGNLRKEILKFGFQVPDEEIQAAEKEANRAARRRTMTIRQHRFAQTTRRFVRRATLPFRFLLPQSTSSSR